MTNEDENDIIQFGKQMLIHFILGTSIALFMAICLDVTIKGTLFLCLVFPLRQYSGGIHVGSLRVCTFLSLILFGGVFLFIKYVMISKGIQICMFSVTAFVILSLAPIDNPSNPLDAHERCIIRNKARLWLTAESLLFILLFCSRSAEWAQPVLLSVLVTSVLVLTGHIKNRISAMNDSFLRM
jgi:accessory gene regulator B